MDPESTKPSSWFNRFVSSLSWLLPASILNTSNTDHVELGVTNSIPSYPTLPSSIPEGFDSSSSSSYETFYRGDGNGAESAPPSPAPSMQSPTPFYCQMQTTEPTDLEHLPAGDSASTSESSPRDGGKVSPPQPSTIATQPSPNSKISTRVEKLQTNEVRVLISNTEEQKADAAHPVLEIIDEQELGRNVLVLAIPMVMGLVLSSNPLAMHVPRDEGGGCRIVLCFCSNLEWDSATEESSNSFNVTSGRRNCVDDVGILFFCGLFFTLRAEMDTWSLLARLSFPVGQSSFCLLWSGEGGRGRE